MKRDYLVYIEDILDAMDKAELILADVTYEQLEDDFKINFAVVRALEIVGEATKRCQCHYGINTRTSLGKEWPGCVTGLFTAMTM